MGSHAHRRLGGDQVAQHDSHRPEPLEGAADVVIVGGRCAGATLAAELAERGRSVVLIDRSDFPSDAFSTHLVQANGAGYLAQHGVLSALSDAGSPLMPRVKVCFDGVVLDHHFDTHAPYGAAVSASRKVLDAALLERARRAGASVLTRCTFEDVIVDDGRVCGARAVQEGRPVELRGRLVVGCDGRQSAFAAAVGARRYHVAPGDRCIYWADYGGVDPGFDPAVWNVRHGPDIWLAFFSDGGRFTVAVLTPAGDRPPVGDVSTWYDAKIAGCPELTGVLGDSERLGRPIGTCNLDSYYREASGPGWVLVGDSGVFKDPVMGQGIGDAFRHAATLAARLDTVDLADPAALDAATAEFGRWRDRDLWQMYWLAVDAAAGRGLNDLEHGVFAVLAERPTLGYRFAVDLPSHWRPPRQVLSPATIGRAAWHAWRVDGAPAGALASQMFDRARLALHRAAIRRRPRYESAPTR